MFPLKPTQEKQLKMLTPKQMLQKLPVALAEVNTGNRTKMETIFMNSENSTLSETYGLLINLSDKINLEKSYKYIALSNHTIHGKI